MKGKIKVSWLDIEAKKKSKVPDPGTYNIKEKVVNKMKFMKGKRVTEIQEYMKKNKWKLPPGAHFKNKSSTAGSNRSHKGIMDSKGSKFGYIDDAIAKGYQSPAHIYKAESKLTQKRSIFGSFSKGGRKPLFKKGKSKGGEYKHVESFYKTQVKNRV